MASHFLKNFLVFFPEPCPSNEILIKVIEEPTALVGAFGWRKKFTLRAKTRCCFNHAPLKFALDDPKADQVVKSCRIVLAH